MKPAGVSRRAARRTRHPPAEPRQEGLTKIWISSPLGLRSVNGAGRIRSCPVGDIAFNLLIAHHNNQGRTATGMSTSIVGYDLIGSGRDIAIHRVGGIP